MKNAPSARPALSSPNEYPSTEESVLFFMLFFATVYNPFTLFTGKTVDKKI